MKISFQLFYLKFFLEQRCAAMDFQPTSGNNSDKRCVPNLGLGYTHLHVNQSAGIYVDPSNPLYHINGIEGVWGRLKFKSMHGTTTTMAPSHIAEFMWRERVSQPFQTILTCVASHLKKG